MLYCAMPSISSNLAVALLVPLSMIFQELRRNLDAAVECDREGQRRYLQGGRL